MTPEQIRISYSFEYALEPTAVTTRIITPQSGIIEVHPCVLLKFFALVRTFE